jgi:hypothetical protein
MLALKYEEKGRWVVAAAVIVSVVQMITICYRARAYVTCMSDLQIEYAIFNSFWPLR